MTFSENPHIGSCYGEIKKLMVGGFSQANSMNGIANGCGLAPFSGRACLYSNYAFVVLKHPLW